MESYLESINRDEMVAQIIKWAETPSHSYNIEGLNNMLSILQDDFSVLGGEAEVLTLSPHPTTNEKGERIFHPIGNVLSIKKRPEAKKQVLLAGHMDTVFTEEMGFIHCSRPNDYTLVGPGVIDMKGGLSVMLQALKAFEASPFASQVGWEVLINGDEEIGSPGSGPIFEKKASQYDVGLIFEPAFTNGGIVTQRKGSTTFTLKIQGTSAHAGRDFFSGKSAIAALADILRHLHELNHPEKGITLNLGYIYGGGAVNIVPDLALCKLNIRTYTAEHTKETVDELYHLAATIGKKHGVSHHLIEEINRPPKPETPEIIKLFETFSSLAKRLGFSLPKETSGGVCDGNILANAGLVNLDTLGPVGGKMHTKEEYLEIESLEERAKLTALYLMELGNE